MHSIGNAALLLLKGSLFPFLTVMMVTIWFSFEESSLLQKLKTKLFKSQTKSSDYWLFLSRTLSSYLHFGSVVG